MTTAPALHLPIPSGTAGHSRTGDNNFDFIRIVAASLVLFSHQFALTAQKEPTFFDTHSYGGMSVRAFFIISGFLVTFSWYNDPHFLRFCFRRILRIWPALITVAVVTAYGLGTIVTKLSTQQYIQHPATFEYLGILWMKVQFILPGVFEDNPYPLGVNGSLWTIPIEVLCYIVLSVVGLLKLMARKNIFLLLILGYWIWFLNTGNADVTGRVRQSSELSAYFLAGAALYVTRASWEKHTYRWTLVLTLGTALLWWLGFKYTALLLGMPFIVIFYGTRSFAFFRRFGRWGDPSYGIYLIAFPVQQTVIFYTWPAFGFLGTLILSSIITVALAFASWHGIEKKALRFKPKRRLMDAIVKIEIKPEAAIL